MEDVEEKQPGRRQNQPNNTKYCNNTTTFKKFFPHLKNKCPDKHFKIDNLQMQTGAHKTITYMPYNYKTQILTEMLNYKYSTFKTHQMFILTIKSFLMKYQKTIALLAEEHFIKAKRESDHVPPSSPIGPKLVCPQR